MTAFNPFYRKEVAQSEFTGRVKVIDDVETSRMCERIAERLELRGSMTVQLRLTEIGPRVFEINSRLS